MKKQTKPKTKLEVVFVGASGTHYTQNDYDYYCKLMTHSAAPILPQKAYFEALEADRKKQANIYNLPV